MAKVGAINPSDVATRLEYFESKYSLASAEFIDAFRNGRLRETEDFHSWAHWVSIRELFERRVVDA
jgi:hypothetical protein